MKETKMDANLVKTGVNYFFDFLLLKKIKKNHRYLYLFSETALFNLWSH